MALTFRFYRTPMIVTEIRPGMEERHCALADYINEDGSGQTFQYWIHDARDICYALSLTTPETHTLIDADATITPFSPELGDVLDLNEWLEGSLQGTPQAIRTLFEQDGFNVGWATASTTRREMLRYISRIHEQTRDLHRQRNDLTKALYRTGLDATVGTLPAAARNGVSTWMQNKGMQTGWITLQTPIRTVLQYISVNANWRAVGFGPVGPFDGEI